MNKRKTLNIVIFIFLCFFTLKFDVKAKPISGMCDKEEIIGKIKGTSINEQDKLCVYSTKNNNDGETEYLSILFKYSSSKNDYSEITKVDCSTYNFFDERSNDTSFSGCDKYIVVFNELSQAFYLEDKESVYCDSSDTVCLEYDNSVNEEPEQVEGGSCKIKDSDIELLNLSKDGDFSVISTKKGNVCPAETNDKGATFNRIEYESFNNFNCSELQNNWKIVTNNDLNTNTLLICRYYLIDKKTVIDAPLDVDDIEETGNLIVTYYFYGGSKSNVIKILQNSDSSYKAVDSNGVTIDSLTDDVIKANIKEDSNYPSYIIKLKGSSSYTFVDGIKNEEGKYVEFDKLYYREGLFNPDGTGLSDEEIITTCKQLFGDTFLNFLNDYVFKIIWIGVPIILILLTSFDFAKVVFNDDKDGMQKAFSKLWKRAIAAVLIFLTPYIVILIANIIDPTQTTIQSCAKKIRELGNTSIVIK